jgi:hypothetical protein
VLVWLRCLLTIPTCEVSTVSLAFVNVSHIMPPVSPTLLKRTAAHDEQPCWRVSSECLMSCFLTTSTVFCFSRIMAFFTWSWKSHCIFLPWINPPHFYAWIIHSKFEISNPTLFNLETIF